MYRRTLLIQKWVDAYDRLREGKGHEYWEIDFLHAILWCYQKRLSWGSAEAAKCPNMLMVMLFGWSKYTCSSRIIPKATRLRSDIRDGDVGLTSL
jgi:hypothetical protein